MTSFIIFAAACRVERQDSETTPAAIVPRDTLTFGQAGGNGGLTPAPDPANEPTGTVTDTGTADEPTEPDTITTVEDTGSPVSCQSSERLVTVLWDAYSDEPISEINISGMLEAVYSGYVYVVNMQTGSPSGMTVESTSDEIAAEYDLCVPIGARFEWSVSYRDVHGVARYSCEGENLVENGQLIVFVYEDYDDTGFIPALPIPVLNGSGGCEHEFWL